MEANLIKTDHPIFKPPTIFKLKESRHKFSATPPFPLLPLPPPLLLSGGISYALCNCQCVCLFQVPIAQQMN